MNTTLRVRKENGENCLDGSAYAIVFLRAKYAGATELHMQILTHDISFNIDLSLMYYGTKTFYFSVENRCWSFSCLTEVILSPH